MEEARLISPCSCQAAGNQTEGFCPGKTGRQEPQLITKCCIVMGDGARSSDASAYGIEITCQGHLPAPRGEEPVELLWLLV